MLNISTLYPNPSPVNLTPVQFDSHTGIWVEWGMKNLFKYISLFIITLVMSSATASADYQKGLDAALEGDFATAMKLWRPLAEEGNATVLLKRDLYITPVSVFIEMFDCDVGNIVFAEEGDEVVIDCSNIVFVDDFTAASIEFVF